MTTARSTKTAFIAMAVLLIITVGISNAEKVSIQQNETNVSQYEILKATIQGELSALLATHALQNKAIDTERAKLAVVFCATAERAARFGKIQHAVKYYKLSLSMSPLYQKSIMGLKRIQESRNS